MSEEEIKEDNKEEIKEKVSEDISEETKEEKSKSRRKALFSYLRIVIIAAAAVIFFETVVIINAKVPTGSMIETINENDRLVGLRLAYVGSEPKRGDIVIFKYPDDESTKFVKRVIGLPGETVSFENGDVYIDGELLDEPYIREPHSTMAVTETQYTVPEGSYFMLGDNRRNSKDSRWWTNTFVTKKKILAKVMFRYWDGENNKLSFSGF